MNIHHHSLYRSSGFVFIYFSITEADRGKRQLCHLKLKWWEWGEPRAELFLLSFICEIVILLTLLFLFFFNFWDCNLVTLLSFFYSLQTLPYIPLPFPSHSWPLLSLIVIARTYVFICAYTFLNGTCNVPVILLYVCVQGWLLALAHPWCALPQASALESCGTPAWSCPQQSWKKSICKLPRS